VKPPAPTRVIAAGTPGRHGHNGEKPEQERAIMNFHLNGTSSPGVGKGTEQPSSDPSEVVGIHSDVGREQTSSQLAAVPLPIRCDNALCGVGIKPM
jgi:hypothetical protein